MQSMTGYGKAEYSSGNLNLVVEIKTVNNRFLDVVTKYPRCFVCFDDLIRKIISSKIARGRLEIFITLVDNRETDKTIDVDLSLAKGYYNAYQIIKDNFSCLKDDFSLMALLRSPDVLKQGAESFDYDFFEKILTDTLNEALDNLNSMRKIEGDKLKTDCLQRMNEIELMVTQIALRAPLVKENYHQKLTERISEALKEVKYDEARLMQEVAIFADKSNIDEELTRLRSHISQFRQIVNSENAGRKLDFLVQEFNRETNTICSKSNDLEITQVGLNLKCEIEKIREQIQNIE